MVVGQALKQSNFYAMSPFWLLHMIHKAISLLTVTVSFMSKPKFFKQLNMFSTGLYMQYEKDKRKINHR